MTISLTIPNEPSAIAAAIGFFNALQGSATGRISATVAQTSNGPADADDADDTAASAGAGVAGGGTMDAKRDPKGVAFDANFCANASDPFYATGPRAGQWKKRKNLADAAYDTWYDERLQDIAPAGTVTTQGEDEHVGGPVDTGAAFGAAAAAAATTAGAKAAPQTAGEFMAWVSEKQAAGVLTQPNIQAAYGFAGLQIADLFVADVGLQAKNVGTLYQILVQTAGA